MRTRFSKIPKNIGFPISLFALLGHRLNPGPRVVPKSSLRVGDWCRVASIGDAVSHRLVCLNQDTNIERGPHWRSCVVVSPKNFPTSLAGGCSLACHMMRTCRVTTPAYTPLYNDFSGFLVVSRLAWASPISPSVPVASHHRSFDIQYRHARENFIAHIFCVSMPTAPFI